MVLQQLQDLLAGIYDLPVQYKVYDFLFTERERLPQTVRESSTDEQLLVLDEGGAAAVGLFLDAQLLERLAAANPLEALHGGNLADYWTALEGVSHFIYLAWNAGHDRGVSLLELELQAEIDKYVSSWLLLREQDPARYPAGLHRLLFERSRIDVRLAGDLTVETVVDEEFGLRITEVLHDDHLDGVSVEAERPAPPVASAPPLPAGDGDGDPVVDAVAA